MKHVPLKDIYMKKVLPALEAQFHYGNALAAPKIKKAVVNVGIGKFLKEPKRVEEIVAAIEEITGQKAVLTRAKKAIAGFKIRENLEVGVKVTLRGKRMWHFLDRLVKTALPRVRDFQGIAMSAVDAGGNLNVGIKDQTVFPEIAPEKVQTLFSFQVNVATSAKNHEEGEELFRHLGFPLRKEIIRE